MPNILLCYRGTIGSDEQFIHTLAVTTGLSDLAVIAGHARTAFETAWAANLSTFPPRFGNTVTWRDVTAATILPPGDGPLSAAHIQALGTGFVGGGTSLPNQVAVAISLKGGTYLNGTPIRGRFFLPTPATSMIATGGKISAAVVTIVLDFVQELFAQLNARDLHPGVWSRKLGTVTAVTELRMGDVPDTMRSRRNQRVETYFIN